MTQDYVYEDEAAAMLRAAIAQQKETK